VALLEVENLRTYFETEAGLARAVDGVSFSVDKGEVLGIVGESGSGKSVTSLSIMRLVPQPPGRIMPGSRILFKGRDLLGLSAAEMRHIRGNDIAMIFQEPMTSLNPVYPVGDQIAEAIRYHRGVGKRQARARAVELLRQVGIPDPERRAADYPHQLSGGMRQRVMIAMAISCEPDLLIADEPTTALDVTIQAQILDLLAELRERLGMAMILITHDLGVVAQVCDRVVVMYAGQVVEEASVDDLFREPRHPYTEGLLKAIPRLGKPVERLAVIPGTVPSPTAWPVSCRFHPRCPYGWDLCVEAAPGLFPTGEDRAEGVGGVSDGALVSGEDRGSAGVRTSRCWLERHPERREEVRRRTGAYEASRVGRAEAPAEQWHAASAAEHAAPEPERAPPEAPSRPIMGDPDTEEDVRR
jgi:oligopeptide/dipeptide ABC transporter ATP-binding protein